jgi:hypothetical protein
VSESGRPVFEPKADSASPKSPAPRRFRLRPDRSVHFIAASVEQNRCRDTQKGDFDFQGNFSGNADLDSRAGLLQFTTIPY